MVIYVLHPRKRPWQDTVFSSISQPSPVVSLYKVIVFVMAFATTRQWNGWNFFVCFLISLGQIAFGYPSSVISVTLAQPPFLSYMGLLDLTQNPPALSPNADSIIGAMSGVC